MEMEVLGLCLFPLGALNSISIMCLLLGMSHQVAWCSFNLSLPYACIIQTVELSMVRRSPCVMVLKRFHTPQACFAQNQKRTAKSRTMIWIVSILDNGMVIKFPTAERIFELEQFS